MGVGGQRHAPATLPPGMTQYPLYRRLGKPQGRSGRVLKISPPPGFDPRTVQLVASRYTNYVIPAHLYMKVVNKLYPIHNRVHISAPCSVKSAFGLCHASLRHNHKKLI
jgi:hypothetical protein